MTFPFLGNALSCRTIVDVEPQNVSTDFHGVFLCANDFEGGRCECECLHKCLCVYQGVSVCMWRMCVCGSVYVSKWMCVCACVCVCEHTCVCIQLYTYVMYIHMCMNYTASNFCSEILAFNRYMFARHWLTNHPRHPKLIMKRIEHL